FDWVASHPQPMTEQETNHLAFAFVNVKLKSRPDAVDLDPKADSPDHEELAKSSPDDRLDQALKELRDAVADEVLENLLQVSPSRFE
ncbi:adenine/cytosine-specific restriction endonuclease Mrr, partial [Escherichia coli]|nr:adenine/cytosine-specific restriction endonuclease Mrr [Escherichia coli]